MAVNNHFYLKNGFLTNKIMVSPSKRQIHNRRISASRKKNIEPKRTSIVLNSLNFVFSIIACGIHYSKTALCFLLNDIRPPKKTTLEIFSKFDCHILEIF